MNASSRLWGRAKQVGRHVPGLRKLWHAFRARGAATPAPPTRPSTLFPTPEAARHFQNVRPAYAPCRDRPFVLHCIGSLGPGGAERQLCNLLVAIAKAGHASALLHFYELTGDGAHFVPPLLQGGVKLLPLPAYQPPFNAADPPDLARLSDGRLPHLFDLCQAFRLLRPDIVHCWLDYTNVLAGLAAALAGVPAVILSTRNVNPTHFAFHQPWFQPWYRLLARQGNVHFINNSHAGADDYADWLSLDRKRFHVILNGVDVDALPRTAPSEATALRASLGLSADTPLVAGVFRLSDEKQPLIFVDVLQRLPAAHAVIAGVGALEGEVRRHIAATGLDRRVHLLGRRDDVPAILSAADVLLLTSRAEGTPNALLEAQWLGCPVVSTRAGGAADAVADGRTGRLLPIGDVAGLTAAVQELLTHPDLRRRYGQAGPDFIRQRFGLERMVQETERLYRLAVDASAPG